MIVYSISVHKHQSINFWLAHFDFQSKYAVQWDINWLVFATVLYTTASVLNTCILHAVHVAKLPKVPRCGYGFAVELLLVTHVHVYTLFDISAAENPINFVRHYSRFHIHLLGTSDKILWEAGFNQFLSTISPLISPFFISTMEIEIRGSFQSLWRVR